ncbi:MAG TPA: hypothetical protein VKA31_02470 [Mariprofundaceae bacterium]|nr:hypothetical protein [Mariprofundaceae bacterium]
MTNKEQDKGRMAEKYDKLAHRFNEIYQKGKTRGHGAMQEALEKARKQLTELGEFSAEHGQELKQFLSRDLDRTVAEAQHLGEGAKEWLHPSRLRAGALASLASALEWSGDTLHSMGNRAQQSLVFKTGEITSGGTLTCQGCGQKMHFKETGHIPPCPKCKGPLFHKGY